MIAGGGTAGHLLPGIAVADALVERGHDPASIHFVGAQRGMEAEVVPAAGYRVTLLPGRGIQRRLTIENLRSAWGLVRAVFMALGLFRRHRPTVVLVTGGYAAAACAVAAVLWRVPIVVADQNARAGAVNRLVGSFAAASAVPFAATDLPRSVLTGNPVRAEVRHRAARRDPAEAREELGLPQDRSLLAVFAGSLGARRLNTVVDAAVQGPWAGRGDLSIHHVVGARDWDGTDRSGAASVSEGPRDGAVFHNRVRYEGHMELVLDAADLVLCRSGGTSVAELALMGTPAILVPLPIATRDHQRANAAELVAAGAAVLIDDADLDVSRVVSTVEPLIADPDRLTAMSVAARSLGKPDAADAVAELLERYAR